MQSFDPRLNETFSIFLSPLELRFEFIPHPQATGMVHSMRAGKSTVYRLRDLDAPGEYALKVMRARFRDPVLELKCTQLDRLKQLSGLEVCDRRCLSLANSPDTIRRFPSLEYSILMPWISGTSWFDVHVSDNLGRGLTKYQCFQLASNLASILARLETADVAHCDLSPANIIVDLNAESLRVELIDVEEFYGPNFAAAHPQPVGTPGYQHRTSRKAGWCPEADRFSGALLLSEMLAWHSPTVRQYSNGETYFDPAELQLPPGFPRFEALAEAVRDQSPDLEQLLRRAWDSKELSASPSLGEWDKALKHVQAVSTEVVWVPKDYSHPRKKAARRCWNRPAPEIFWTS